MNRIKVIWLIWIATLLLILFISSCANEPQKDNKPSEDNTNTIFQIIDIQGHSYIVFKGLNGIHNEACDNH